MNYLRQCQPMKPLTASPVLIQAARDHCEDLSRHVDTKSHVGSDGSTLAQRISRYGAFRSTSGSGGNYQ